MSCFITVIKHKKYVSQFVNIKYLNISAQCRVSSKSNPNDVCDRLSRWYGRQEKLWKTFDIKTKKVFIISLPTDFIRKWIRFQTQFSTPAQHPKLWWTDDIPGWCWYSWSQIVVNNCTQHQCRSGPASAQLCTKLNIQDSILIPHPPSQAQPCPVKSRAYLLRG